MNAILPYLNALTLIVPMSGMPLVAFLKDRGLSIATNTLHIDNAITTEYYETIATYKYLLLATTAIIIPLAAFLVYYSIRYRILQKIYKKLKKEFEEKKNNAGNTNSTLALSTRVDGNTNAVQDADRTVQVNTPSHVTYDPDRLLFIKMKKQLMENNAYLNPELTRDDLAALMGVDKNHFANIMKKFSGASSCTVYLNKKRIDYATRMMGEFPNFTIEAIAKACGMTNTVTFTNYFKRYYHMTPSEYRALLENASK